MDRIDIQKEVKPVNFFNLKDESSAMTSEEIRIKVEGARIIQQKRYKNKKGMNRNSQMSTSDIQKYCELDAELLKQLREKSERYKRF